MPLPSGARAPFTSSVETLVTIETRSRPVSALLLEADHPVAAYVLAHGAGAGIRHSFMAEVATALAAAGVTTLRYQFPYMEAGTRRPDAPAVAVATVRAAVARARELLPDLPLVAGGKSFGGRMTSTAAAELALEGVGGLVFLGFPLHPPKRPAITRGDHLDRVTVPMLFLQGTRDDLADLGLIRTVCGRLGATATLHEVAEANHGFEVPKRTGQTHADIILALAQTAAAWIKGVAG